MNLLSPKEGLPSQLSSYSTAELALGVTCSSLLTMPHFFRHVVPKVASKLSSGHKTSRTSSDGSKGVKPALVPEVRQLKAAAVARFVRHDNEQQPPRPLPGAARQSWLAEPDDHNSGRATAPALGGARSIGRVDCHFGGGGHGGRHHEDGAHGAVPSSLCLRRFVLLSGGRGTIR